MQKKRTTRVVIFEGMRIDRRKCVDGDKNSKTLIVNESINHRYLIRWNNS